MQMTLTAFGVPALWPMKPEPFPCILDSLSQGNSSTTKTKASRSRQISQAGFYRAGGCDYLFSNRSQLNNWVSTDAFVFPLYGDVTFVSGSFPWHHGILRFRDLLNVKMCTGQARQTTKCLWDLLKYIETEGEQRNKKVVYTMKGKNWINYLILNLSRIIFFASFCTFLSPFPEVLLMTDYF